MTIGIRNLEQALLGFTRPIFFRGEVDAGALVGSIPIKNVVMVANQFQGLLATPVSGLATGQWSRITSNTPTTLVINPNLLIAPAEDDEIIILAFGAEASNIQEWGGTAQTGADLTPLFQKLAQLDKLIPIAKANEFDLPAPGANTDILAQDIVPTNSPSILRVTVQVAANSVFKAVLTQGAVSKDLKFNGGVALTGGATYMFDLPWETGDSINFQVEANVAIDVLKAHEIGGAA